MSGAIPKDLVRIGKTIIMAILAILFLVGMLRLITLGISVWVDEGYMVPFIILILGIALLWYARNSGT